MIQSGEINISTLKIESKIGLFDIVSVHVNLEVNQHGKFWFTCILRQPDRGMHEALAGSEITILYSQEGSKHPLFAGYITEYAIRYEGRVTYADITAISGSIEFDREFKSRTFQNMSETYGGIFEKIAGKGRALFAVGRGSEKITAPLIQYEETDWQFVNRIAGRWNTVVIPETTNVFPQIAIGIVAGGEYNLEGKQDYHTMVDFKSWRMQGKEKGLADEFQEYSLSTSRNMQLGDKVYFKQQKWIVVKKQMILDKGVLKLSYCLGHEKGRSRFIRNEKLCGLSLEGSVVESQGEKIKIALDIDRGGSQNLSDLYAYDYVPITGNLMYSMPEKDARVSLYFPGTEESGMVINCLQRNIDYADHKMKVMEIPAGHQLQMTPGQVSLFTKRQSSSIKIADRIGIVFKSHSVMQFKANDTISLKGKNLKLTSDNRIFLGDRQNGDFIEIAGRQMYYHASRSVLSAVKHKTSDKTRSIQDYVVIKDLEAVALSVMGGLRAADTNELDAKVEASIPVLCNGDTPFMKNIASISWKRTI